MKLYEVTQRKLEQYEAALIEKGEESRSAAFFNRVVIEAAVDAGIAEINSKTLPDQKPWQVAQWTREILAHVAAAKEPPSSGES